MRFLILILALALHIVCGQYYSSGASVGVNFQNIEEPYLTGGAMAHAHTEERPRTRRMYAMCPPNFQRIGQECFSLPEQHSSWLEAHFFCKDKNARLAEPDKYADRKLREFFLKYDGQTGNTDPIWIGSTYDYMNNIWQWSISGRNLTYDAFSKKFFENKKIMDNQCAVYDPQLRYRWSSRNCVDKNRFICQHKMPKVSENNREKVYHRWNATYPHQMANEVLLEVIDRREKGRYNRRVVASGSNEVMVVPTKPRNRQNNRRRPRPTSASLPEQNDVNYETQQASTHPNDIQQHYNPTNEPRYHTPANNNNNDNEIRVPQQQLATAVPANVERKVNKRRRTMFDRKLQRQREKELKRLQRKKERQEKMRREKEERLKRQRLEKEQQRRQTKEERQRLRAKKQKELEALRKSENYQKVKGEQRVKQQEQPQEQPQQYKQQEIDNLRKQQDAEDKKHLEDQEEERRRQAYLATLKEQEEQERAKRQEIQQQERQRQEEEERKQHEERKALEERMRKEYQERLKQAEDERARQLAEEQERKRLQDEDNRRKLDEEEKQRQHELKKQLDEEEERARLKRLEEERIAEEKELARLREEQRKRAEIQRKREEEIARIEEEQRRIEEEEARIKQKLEEADRQANLQHEYENRRAEEEANAKEEERKRSEEQEERDRLAKMEQAKRIVDSQKDENHEHVIENVRQRFNSLSPELRLEFIRQRKERKRQKQLKEQQKLKEQQA